MKGMTTGKNRLEAFSVGMFAIIRTVLVLELKVPHLADASFAVFVAAMGEIAPKLFSFLFSFFILAIFWVNHHHLVHAIQKVDAKLLWLNPGVVALFPLNMGCRQSFSVPSGSTPLSTAISRPTL